MSDKILNDERENVKALKHLQGSLAPCKQDIKKWRVVQGFCTVPIDQISVIIV